MSLPYPFQLLFQNWLWWENCIITWLLHLHPSGSRAYSGPRGFLLLPSDLDLWPLGSSNTPLEPEMPKIPWAGGAIISQYHHVAICTYRVQGIYNVKDSVPVLFWNLHLRGEGRKARSANLKTKHTEPLIDIINTSNPVLGPLGLGSWGTFLIRVHN